MTTAWENTPLLPQIPGSTIEPTTTQFYRIVNQGEFKLDGAPGGRNVEVFYRPRIVSDDILSSWMDGGKLVFS